MPRLRGSVTEQATYHSLSLGVVRPLTIHHPEQERQRADIDPPNTGGLGSVQLDT